MVCEMLLQGGEEDYWAFAVSEFDRSMPRTPRIKVADLSVAPSPRRIHLFILTMQVRHRLAGFEQLQARIFTAYTQHSNSCHLTVCWVAAHS